MEPFWIKNRMKLVAMSDTLSSLFMLICPDNVNEDYISAQISNLTVNICVLLHHAVLQASRLGEDVIA